MRTILVPVDFSEVTKAAVQLARREARVSKAWLHLLYVCQRSEGLSDFERQQEALASLADPCQDEGIKVETEIVYGDPVDEILEAIQRIEPELVVVGSHGHGAVYDLLVGSVAEALLRKSPCPVLVLPPSRHDR